nr:putative reverse transcriptase domain-containing protein [Tanacetum cinerariifolium]
MRGARGRAYAIGSGILHAVIRVEIWRLEMTKVMIVRWLVKVAMMRRLVVVGGDDNDGWWWLVEMTAVMVVMVCYGDEGDEGADEVVAETCLDAYMKIGALTLALKNLGHYIYGTRCTVVRASELYKLELPRELNGVHITFHVSNLKEHLFNENLGIPIDEIKLDDKLHLIEEPVEIMDREVKQLKQSRIPIVKGEGGGGEAAVVVAVVTMVWWFGTVAMMRQLVVVGGDDNDRWWWLVEMTAVVVVVMVCHGDEGDEGADEVVAEIGALTLALNNLGHYIYGTRCTVIRASELYKLELPRELSGVHITFHVSNLKEHLSDENLGIPIDEIKLDDKLHLIEEPIEIMDREVKQLKQSRIPIVKVRWNSRRGPKYTWEREDLMRQKKTPKISPLEIVLALRSKVSLISVTVSKGDMNMEAKSSSSGSYGKFIEVVIMLILYGSYYCFIHGYYYSTTVNIVGTKVNAASKS